MFAYRHNVCTAGSVSLTNVSVVLALLYIGNFCLSFFPFRYMVFSFNCASDCSSNKKNTHTYNKPQNDEPD